MIIICINYEVIGKSILCSSAYYLITLKVGKPSMVEVEELTIYSTVSPLANLKPKVLFLDNFPNAVNIKSPIPANPNKVSYLAP